MHLSSHLADLLFLPLEALFVRSVALGFLFTAEKKLPSGPLIPLRSEVIPLGCWFGMGIRPGGVSQYLKNLAFCGALEVAVGLGVWQLSTGVSTFRSIFFSFKLLTQCLLRHVF